jgi:hypothetical protein
LQYDGHQDPIKSTLRLAKTHDAMVQEMRLVI